MGVCIFASEAKRFEAIFGKHCLCSYYKMPRYRRDDRPMRGTFRCLGVDEVSKSRWHRAVLTRITRLSNYIIAQITQSKVFITFKFSI